VLTRVALLAALLLGLAHAAEDPVTLVRSIPNPLPGRGDFFGAAAVLAGDGILVGAPADEVEGVAAGAAYLLVAATGALRQPLVGPGRGADDQFGFALAVLDGDPLVAAPHHDSGAAHAGAVYRFDRATGSLVLTIANPTPTQSDAFGYALAAGGGRVLVGAPFKDSDGAAFVFDGASGALLQTLVNPEPTLADAFGRAVALAGMTAVVGAPLKDPGSKANAGAVHQFDATTGALVRTLVSPRLAAFEQFGAAVATDGTRVVVGAPFDGTAGSNAGAVYVFDAGTGDLLATLVSPTPSADARFGTALALAGDALLVGAPFDDLDAVNAGAAYLFDIPSGALRATVRGPRPAAGDQLGNVVDLAWTTVLVGAWLADGVQRDAGAVHVFVDPALATGPTTTTVTTTIATTSTASSTSGTTTTTTTATTVTTTAAATTSTTTTATLGEPSTTTTATAPSTTAVPPSVTTTTGSSPTAPFFTTTTNVFTPLPPCDNSACDDGDPCTLDACPGGVCQHAPLEGFDGVGCRLDALESFLRRTAPVDLGGARLAKQLQAKAALARRLVEAARTSNGRRAARRLRRADRTLAAFGVAVGNGERRRRIGQPVAETLRALVSDVVRGLSPLRAAAGR